MLYSIVAVLVLFLDQAVKFWTTKNIVPLALGEETVQLIPGVVHMTNIQNYGAAFSILENMRWFLVGVSVVFIIVIIVLISMEIIHTPFGRWTAVLVMAGALGNCIDRVMYGYVVDMFEIELFNFAVFNVADIFITVCGLLFCIHVIFYREPAAVAAAEPSRKPVKATTKKAAEPAEQKMRRTKPSKAKEDPYANIPRRGEHRSLADELRLENPDDPFAEWNFGDVVEEPAPRRRRAAEPEEEQPVSRRTRQAAAEEPEEQPAPRQGRRVKPTVELEEDDLFFEQPPVRKSAPAPASKPKPAAPAPKPAKTDLDAGFEDYSLEDILSEFRDS